MPIRIRREVLRSRHKKIPDRVGMVVAGPPELFTNALTDRLALAGFRKSRSKFDRDSEVWRLQAGVGPTPDHLLRSLSSVAYVEGAPEVEAAVQRGSEAREGAGAGAAALRVGVLGPYFCANCDAENAPRRALLEGAGWFPLFAEAPGPEQAPLIKAFGDFPYVTQDGVLAMNLQPWMTADAQKALLERLTADKRRVARSGAKKRIASDPVIPMPEGEALQGFQDAGVNNLLRTRKSGVIYDDMGLGKALPMNAKIATPNGWIQMKDVSVGDAVIGSDGKSTRVIGVYPQGEKEVFKVTFSDGASVECCDEHLWAVNNALRRKRGNSWKIMNLQEIRSTLFDKNGNNNHYIPMVKPVEYRKRTFSVDPYLLGVLLGDGYIKGKAISFSTADSDLVGFVEEAIGPDLRVAYRGKYLYNICMAIKCDGNTERGTRHPLKIKLKNLNLMGKGSDDKFIPPQYLLGSIEQRVSLLQGLLDTDGYVSTSNVVQFSSNSKTLADGVAELVMSLGGNARRSTKVSASGKDHHIITISLPADIRPFRIARKAARYRPRQKYQPTRAIVKVESVGMKPAQCIAVDAPDHLYVTDDYIVTHNTVQGVAYSNARPELSRILVISKANMKLGWARAFGRFGTRPHNPFIIEGASPVIRDPRTGEETPATPRPELLVPNNHRGPLGEGVFDLVIINYDILSHHEEFIRNTHWDLVLVDEIHSVSNEEAIRTRVVFGDMKHPVRRPVRLSLSKGGVIVGLSGTPHPVVERMWPILSGMRPDLFGSGPIARRLFINRYAPPTLFVKEFQRGGRKWEKVMAIPGRPMREAELNRRLRGSGFMTRRLKIDMVDLLPPKSRAALELPFTFTPEEIKELASIDGQIEAVAGAVGARAERADEVARLAREGRAEAIINVVQGLHPKSPEFHEISRLRARIGEIKAPYVARYVIEEAEGEEDLPADIRPKTVIFAHHKTVISAIYQELERRFPGQTIVYDGSVTSDKKRFELENRFQTDDRVRFFLMSLSGASGITLTRANRLYMAELDWDPTNLPQIEDRIWRMTQELPCFIGYFMIPNSLDVQMGNRLIQRMEDNRLIYDRVDLKRDKKPAAKPRKRAVARDEAQGDLFGGKDLAVGRSR